MAGINQLKEENLVGVQQIAVSPREEGLYRVLVTIPSEGHTFVEAYANRLLNFSELGRLQERGRILKENPRFEFHYVTMGRMMTPFAREEAAKIAVDVDMDYLFMIDDDMMCPDDLFLSLFKHNVDIVAPLAFTRNYPHKPVIYSCVDGWDSVSNSEYFINHAVMKYPRNQLVECDAVGFGAVLIKGSVLKGVQAPRFMSTCGTGEDIFFCYQAKKQGFRVFVDTATKLGHLSHPINITEEFVDKMRQDVDKNFDKKHEEYSKYDNAQTHKVILG